MRPGSGSALCPLRLLYGGNISLLSYKPHCSLKNIKFTQTMGIIKSRTLCKFNTWIHPYPISITYGQKPKRLKPSFPCSKSHVGQMDDMNFYFLSFVDLSLKTWTLLRLLFKYLFELVMGLSLLIITQALKTQTSRSSSKVSLFIKQVSE